MHLHWIILTLLILAGAWTFDLFRKKNISLSGMIFLLILLCIGGAFVLRPESSNVLAVSLGIGRGVDAVFLLAILLLLATNLKLYLKAEKLDRDVTELTIRLSKILHHPRH